MLNFPVTILDNFFDDPDAVRRFALEQEYKKDPENKWPGKRTDLIFNLNKELFNHFTRRFFSLFWDFKYSDIDWSVNAYFQKIDSRYNSGWVHPDRYTILSGIIYLNPNPNTNGGTSIFYRKKDKPFSDTIYEEIKEKSYSDRISNEESEKYRLENNNQFKETIRINNVYNRLISFDSYQFHSANSFFGDEKENTERLTLVFFLEKMGSSVLPVVRAKQF
jgi:hypothetical protein